MKTIKDKQILVGADFAGFPLKEAVVAHLKKKGWTVTDVGVRTGDDLVAAGGEPGLQGPGQPEVGGQRDDPHRDAGGELARLGAAQDGGDGVGHRPVHHDDELVGP